MQPQSRSSADPQVLSALAQPFKLYTLQGSQLPTKDSGIATKMTAHVHSSPLATANLIASSVSPSSNSLLDTELEEEMERMVASVVNTPEEPHPCGELPPDFQSLSSSASAFSRHSGPGSERPTKLLLAGGTASPKLSIASQAALGNYRKRCLSGNTTIIVRCNEKLMPAFVQRRRHSGTGAT